jgi:uncharacterized protein YbaP (TraB family)
MEAAQTLPQGVSLRSLMEPGEWAALNAHLRRVGVAQARAERLTPWMVSVLLEMGSRVPAKSLDEQVVDLARAAGVEVRSLESQQEQFAAFDCLGLSEHLLILREALQMPLGFFDELNEAVMDLYAQQQVAALVHRLTHAVPHGDSAGLAAKHLADCAIDKRNARFVRALVPSLQEGGAFVAVGAAHLPGPEGVLARLRGLGFEVQRVPAPTSAPVAAVLEAGR